MFRQQCNLKGRQPKKHPRFQCLQLLLVVKCHWKSIGHHTKLILTFRSTLEIKSSALSWRAKAKMEATTGSSKYQCPTRGFNSSTQIFHRSTRLRIPLLPRLWGKLLKITRAPLAWRTLTTKSSYNTNLLVKRGPFRTLTKWGPCSNPMISFLALLSSIPKPKSKLWCRNPSFLRARFSTLTKSLESGPAQAALAMNCRPKLCSSLTRYTGRRTLWPTSSPQASTLQHKIFRTP